MMDKNSSWPDRPGAGPAVGHPEALNRDSMRPDRPGAGSAGGHPEALNRDSMRPDPAQLEAIRHGPGPCAVIAGPGSGKTFVLTQRIRHLIRSGRAAPGQILVLTFSRAAAAEMQGRFLRSAADHEVVFGTFHAVFYRILRESSHDSLKLIDPVSRSRYLHRLCELHPELKTSAEELQLLISRSKNGLPCRQKWLPALVREYNCFLSARECLDFDDMVLRCLSLLEEEPDVLSYWRDRFQWILVDEFQDVSPSQYAVLRLLAAPLDNLFVVGDDDQSIYGFRGADPSTMRRFLEDYGDRARRISMTVNYRCGAIILRAAGALISRNRSRIAKDLRAGAQEEGSFSCRLFTGRRLQYDFIANALQELTGETVSSAAVIFRTHAGASSFLQVLQDRGIPFDADETVRRTRRAETSERQVLLDLTAYYRAGQDLRSGGARRKDLIRIINRPERLLSGSFLTDEVMTRERILQHAVFDRDTVEEMMDDLFLLQRLSPAYSFRYLMDSIGYRDWALQTYAQKTGRDSRRRRDSAHRIRRFLDSLGDAAASYPDSTAWYRCLQERLQQDPEPEEDGRTQDIPVQTAEREEAEIHKDSPRRVRILTMHACKGLEFDTVFIPDLNEGNVPSRRALSSDQLEEERRLLYVAMTRAKKVLVLTCLEGTADRPAAPSRFLEPFL